jgi:asparagine synthase (glutamine-hydrolysing)
MRLRRGEGKWLMKRALRDHLPEDILYRPKMGFVTPISAWFRGALADEAQRLARSATLADTGWFDMAVIERIAADHRAGRAEYGRTLWQLAMLDRSVARLFA